MVHNAKGVLNVIDLYVSIAMAAGIPQKLNGHKPFPVLVVWSREFLQTLVQGLLPVFRDTHGGQHPFNGDSDQVCRGPGLHQKDRKCPDEGGGYFLRTFIGQLERV